MRGFSGFSVFSFLAILGFSFTLHAASFKKSVVEIRDERGQVQKRIFTEIARASVEALKTDPDAPVVVLLNGLIYETSRWLPAANDLADQGLTVIRMSFSAQPESLRLLSPSEASKFLNKELTLSDLSEEIRVVLKHHKVTRPVTLVGLSYSSTVAAEFAKSHPDLTENILLLSPLVVPLDNYQASSQPLRNMLEMIRFWENAPCAVYGWFNPWLCSQTDFWYDAFYNYFYENYLNTRVSSVPEDLDPAVYKRAVFQLVRAVRDFDLKTEVGFLKDVHFALGEKDEARLKQDQLKAWSLVPEKEKRSLAQFKDAVHALPDEAPKATAWWIENVARKHPDLTKGTEYIISF